jgi:hypothetical protein
MTTYVDFLMDCLVRTGRYATTNVSLRVAADRIQDASSLIIGRSDCPEHCAMRVEAARVARHVEKIVDDVKGLQLKDHGRAL